MAFRIVVPVTLVIALAGCGSFGAIGLPWKREKPEPPPLPSSTSTVDSVQSSDLGAPSPSGNVDQVGGLPVDAGTSAADQPLAPPTGTTTAMDAPTGSGSGGAIGRTDLLGGWTITSGNDSCQLFMTLTSWTGGYRASTKGCTTPLLKSISAWNLQGSSVILAGQTGAPVVTLASSGNNRFDGQANGQGVTFYR
ncbi:MAG TPA: AprI/Inh family metalloprotease inhibitor [Bauldia sp.]|nr:AprI/Inh family metalloprotease inhibitor [Bauldia sp.]